MATNLQSVFLLALATVAVVSCDDIIEPSLEKKQVVLLSPADSATSTGQIQTFRWEAVAGASRYRLQLASPSFDNPAVFFLDTTTVSPAFSTSLLPGQYRWRVQALNSAYASPYTSRLLRVDSTGSLGGQTVQLRRPANQLVTSNSAQVFEWTPLTMAQRYILHLEPHPRLSTAASFDTILTGSTVVALRLAARSQSYRWKVTAINATSLRESAVQTLEIDVTAPGAPTLTTPASGAAVSTQPLTLNWTRAATDVAHDSVYLYRADQTTLISAFPRLSNTPTTTLTAPVVTLTQGTYYWAVRSVDRAGNRGPLTPKRLFTYQ